MEPGHRIATELEHRRQSLLDLTRRNRLLNFRPTRRTTATIVDEVPSELFRLLVLEGKTLGFLPGQPAPPPRAEPALPPLPEREALPLKPPGKSMAREPTPGPASTLELDIGLNRCPFCHDTVAAQEATSVCNQCLSRHHTECWDELGRCASCGGSLALISAKLARPAATEQPKGKAETADDGLTYRRIPREKLPERHRDLDLQTDLPPGDLEKNLLAIYRAGYSTLEEQGFNSLFLALGFLEWCERDAPGRVQKAPLLLVPVELKRRNVRSPFRICAGEDDPIVNPALVYKLQRDWELKLEELPDDLEAFDPDEQFASLAERVAALEGWRVTTEAALGLFSFTKLVMFKDLETHRDHVLQHPLVRRLLGESSPSPQRDAVSDVRAPWDTFSVVNADTSQREAIDAALAGESMVLEGPPGTGKSQTIANIVAEFLADGKSVLFVSEKMAALEVVQSRLEDVGLGAFCLELHSRKTNKQTVVRNLARTLELDPMADHDEDEVLKTLSSLRLRLDGFVDELHEAWGPLRASPYEVLGALEQGKPLPSKADPHDYLTSLDEAPDWTGEALAERQEALESLGRHQEVVGPQAEHPCYGVGLAEVSHGGRARLQVAMNAILTTLLPDAVSALDYLADRAGFRAPERLGQVNELLDLVGILLDPNRPDAAVLQNPSWDGDPGMAETLMELEERRRTLLERIENDFDSAIVERDDLLEISTTLETYGHAWYRIFVGSYRAARAVVNEFRKPEYDPPVEVLVRDVMLAARAHDVVQKLAKRKDEADALFGAAWPAPRGRLSAVGELAKRFRQHTLAGWLDPDFFQSGKPDSLDRKRLAGWREAAAEKVEAFLQGWERFQTAAAYRPERGLGQSLEATTWKEISAALERLQDHLGDLPDWVELQRSQREAEKLGLGAFMERAELLGLSPTSYAATFRATYLLDWLDRVMAQRRRLAEFDAHRHQRSIEEFSRLDRRQLHLARVRLRHRLAAARPDSSWQASAGSELGLLQGEVRRKRGHLPVRVLLQKIPKVIRALKPCLLMSPLSVAQFTDPELHAFDLVIFDEASQIAPEDALGSVSRGKQLVVVGDSKQMPPTSFFQAVVASDQRDQPDRMPDLESILDECVAANLPSRVLRWHYRSRHESLIAFSNQHFYEGRLRTFPSPRERGGRRGLRHVYVEGGVYERGGSGQNQKEAEAVAAAVIEHYRREPQRSLGVGAFSQSQQEAILNAVERRLRAEPSLEPLLAPGEEEHFFVKNLENLQGDERDVIFVSIGYGPDPNGKLHLNFGPLNQIGGERRLNVLVTRARERLVVFTSFHADRIDLARTQSAGVRRLRGFLDYAEKGILERSAPEAQASQAASRPGLAGNSSVADAIASALEAKGLTVARDVGTSSVRVDIAIREDDRFVLGILVDGGHYAAFPTARDRERIVPEVLRGLGWHVVRVWSLEWHHHQWRVVASILEALEAAREEVRNEPEEVAIEAINLKAVPVAAVDEGVVPYQELVVEKKGASEEFPNTPLESIAEVALAVVEAEGPIHEDEVQRRTLAHWDLSRSGKRSRQRIEEALEKTDRIRREGAFLWPRELSEAQVRSRATSGPRDVELIAPEEIAAALQLVVSKEYRLATDDLIKAAAKLLGFTRAGNKVKRAFQVVLEGLENERTVSIDRGIVQGSDRSE